MAAACTNVGMICEAGYARGGVANNAASTALHDNLLVMGQDLTEAQQLSLCAQHVTAMNTASGRAGYEPSKQLYADFWTENWDVTPPRYAQCYVKDPVTDFAGDCGYNPPDWFYIHRDGGASHNISGAALQGCIPSENFRYAPLAGLPPMNLGTGYDDVSSAGATSIPLPGSTDMDIARAGMQCLKFCNDPGNFDKKVGSDGPRQARNAAVLLGTPEDAQSICAFAGVTDYCKNLGLGQDTGSGVANCACFFRRAQSSGPFGNESKAAYNHCYVPPTYLVPPTARLLVNRTDDRFENALDVAPPPSMASPSTSTAQVTALLQPSACVYSHDGPPDDQDLCSGTDKLGWFTGKDHFIFQVSNDSDSATNGAYLGSICKSDFAKACTNNAEGNLQRTPGILSNNIYQKFKDYSLDATLCARALPQ